MVDFSDVKLPEKFRPLLEQDARYKVYYGGRGGGKSFSFAIASLVKAAQRKMTILCCREIQNSISDSVHRILVEVIDKLNFKNIYDVTKTSIRCNLTGSEFIFEGLFRNTDKIKSYQSIDLCWVAEAQPVSEASWIDLLPTVRNPGSEFWVEFNPKWEDDPVYKRFVVHKPDNCVTCKVNWQDNPFFPPELAAERDNDYKYRPNIAPNIWEGDLATAGGLVFPGFDESVHVKMFDASDLKRANVFMAVDPHSSFYSAVVWIALIPKGNDQFYKWVFAEWPTFSTLNAYYYDVRNTMNYEGTYEDMSREFYSIENYFGVEKVYQRYLDTRYAHGTGAGNWQTKTDGIQIEWSKKENGGLLFYCPAPAVMDAQRDAIRKDLEFNHDLLISSINTPLIFVNPACRNTITALRNHRFIEGSERETEHYKDFSDAIRICYAGMSTWHYRDPMQTKKNAFTYAEARPGIDGGWMGV
jgi:PBSX family phage terminase large subunit